MGFEPTNPYGTAASGFKGKIVWSSFKEYLDKNYRPTTVKSRYAYALRFYRLLLNGDFSSLSLLTPNTRLHVLKALCVLSKYLGMYDSFKTTMKKHGLKWGINNADDLIIRRMLKSLKIGSVVDWTKEVNIKVPKLKPYVDFLLATGMRVLEGMDSFNLIVLLQNQNRLHEYYDFDKEMLMHYRHRETFIRKGKKVFISFVPYDILEPIFSCTPIKSRTYYKHLEKQHLPIRFSDIREYWATFMSRYLSRPELDFLQGRTSANVFMAHYFNPSIIEDLQSRTINAVRKILETTH